MKYQLRPAARRDLSQIWSYTADQWGVTKADSYITEITYKIESSINTPNSGSPIHGFQHNYRKLSIGRHRIYYRVSGKTMLVVRILHEKMDIFEHLT